MKTLAALSLVLAIAGCAPQSVSQSVIARSVLNDTTGGWPDYPIIVQGAEAVGQTPQAIATNMRFPAYLRADATFRAIDPAAPPPPTHAHLAIQPGQPLAPATLTFVHGTRRIGVGTFSLPPASYGDGQALGSVSATLIHDMLEESRDRNRNDDGPRKLF